MGLMSEKHIELQNIKAELSSIALCKLVKEYLNQYEINMGVKPPAEQYDILMDELNNPSTLDAIIELTAHFKMEQLIKEGHL